MKERIPHRPILVCYDKGRSISHVTSAKFREIFLEEGIIWYQVKTRKGIISYNSEKVEEMYLRLQDREIGKSG